MCASSLGVLEMDTDVHKTTPKRALVGGTGRFEVPRGKSYSRPRGDLQKRLRLFGGPHRYLRDRPAFEQS